MDYFSNLFHLLVPTVSPLSVRCDVIVTALAAWYDLVIVELSCSAEGAGALAVVGGEVLEEDAELLGEEQVD